MRNPCPEVPFANNDTLGKVQQFSLFFLFISVRITSVAYFNSMSNPNTLPVNQEAHLQKRKLAMQNIRSSLQTIPLVSQNQLMIRSRMNSKCSTSSEESDTDGSSKLTKERTSSVFHAQLFEDKYELLEKLGEGSNGFVYHCKKKRTGEEFAAKSFRFQEEHLASLKANFLYLKRLSHPSIISYEGLYLDTKKHSGWLVMEWVRSPTLKECKITGQSELRGISRKILEVLRFLHKHDIVHRDIKPQNVLYDPETKELKLIDFGIARRCRKRGDPFDMLTITGTLYYRAPEMFSGGYRERVDVWATGILMYYLVCGHTPFESEYQKSTITNIMEADLVFPDKFQDYSSKLRSLLATMLNKNPEERLSASRTLKDTWFSSLTSTTLSRQTTTIQFREDQQQADKNKSCAVGDLKKKHVSFIEDRGYDNREKPFGKDSALSGIQSYIRRVNGEELHCIDSEAEI